jgi:hypothetical protein
MLGGDKFFHCLRCRSYPRFTLPRLGWDADFHGGSPKKMKVESYTQIKKQNNRSFSAASVPCPCWAYDDFVAEFIADVCESLSV